MINVRFGLIMVNVKKILISCFKIVVNHVKVITDVIINIDIAITGLVLENVIKIQTICYAIVAWLVRQKININIIFLNIKIT